MIPLDIVTCGFCGVVNFSEGLEVFRFPVMKMSLCFTDVKFITVPAVSVPDPLSLSYETSSLYKMRKFIMFIADVCGLFLIKLQWPKNKSLEILSF